MVLITQRLKRGPVDSRVGMFPEVFGMADSQDGHTRSVSECVLMTLGLEQSRNQTDASRVLVSDVRDPEI